MLRISATILESYRKLFHTDYGSEEELVGYITGKPLPPRWQMDAGTSWHSLLEKYGNWQPETILGEGAALKSGYYSFSSADVANAVLHIGPGAHEVKVTKVIEVRGGPVELVAKADHVRGLAIQDNKATWSNPGAFDYEPSVQWRVYLFVHDASAFRYNKFAFTDPKLGYCELRDILSFRFWAYPQIEDDVRRWTVQFLDWCHSRRLTEYLDDSHAHYQNRNRQTDAVLPAAAP